MSGMANWKAKIELDIKDLQRQLIDADEKIDKFANEDRKVKLDIDTKTLESAIQKLDKMLDSLGKGTGDFKQFENLSKELSSVVSEVQSLSKAFGKVDDSGAKTLLSSIQNIDKSLSDLSQNIFNVNKNMNNIGVKQIENISNAYDNATKNAEKLAEIQNKLGNKSNSSSDNIIGTMLPSDSEFKNIISNLDTTKSKLGEIVKITEKINSNGKTSYVLKDKNGSTETYDVNSKTQKGQIQSSNYVQYDASAIAKTKKEELEVEHEITKEHEKQVSAQQKKWQSFQKEQQQYLSNQNENEAVDRNQKAYQELTDAIQRYSDVSKRVAGNSALDGDLEEIQKLEDKISKLQKEPILSKSQVEKSERDLVKLYDKLDDLERKVQQANNKSVSNVDKSTESEWDKNTKAIQNYMDAVTKLNNLRASDIGGEKKSEQIASQTQEVEKLKDKAYEARAALSSMVNPHNGDIDTWNKWLEVMNNFDQASLGSAESLAKLKDALRNANNSQIEYMNSVISNYETKANNYSVLSQKENFTPSQAFIKHLNSLQSNIELLKQRRDELLSQPFINQEEIDKFKELIANTENSKKALQQMSAAEKGVKDIGIQKEIDKLNQALERNPKYSNEARQGIQALINQLNSGDLSATTLEKIHTEFLKIHNAEVAAGRAGKGFFDIFKEKSFYGFIGQMQSFLSMYVGFYGLVNAAKKVASNVTEINTQITELAKVSEQSSKQIYNDFSSYADIAQEVRGTISDTISATADWSKNGYSVPDAKQLAEVSQLYRNVGDGIDIDEANESLISTLKGFQLEADQAEHIVDVFNKVSNNEAISSAGIGEALQRSAASFNAASTSLEKSVSLVTATNSVLQDPDKVGKQILAYLYSNVMKIKVAISVKILRRTRPSKDLIIIHLLKVNNMIIYRCLLPNGKSYIGQTHRELKERINEHIRKSKIKTEIGYNYPFYRAIRKYGIENLKWSIIDYADTSEELNEKEKYWISYYDTYILNKKGYNQTIGGEGQNGLIHSKESIDKIRLSELGENNTNAKLTKEQVLKIVDLSKQNKYSQVKLSKMFNTSEGTISRILSGLRWGSVTGIKYNKDSSFLL